MASARPCATSRKAARVPVSSEIGIRSLSASGLRQCFDGRLRMSRPLTQGEKDLAKPIFRDAVNYSLVRIHDGKYMFFQPDNNGMTPNGEIHVAGIYSSDYSGEGPSRQAFFIHEMVQVWQYQTGILTAGVIGSAILEVIGTLGDYDSAYPYVLEGSNDLTNYNLEQQAAVVEDYFRVTKLGLEPRRAQLPYSRTCSPNPRGKPTRQLYETVLRHFLQDPTYGKRPYQRVCAPTA
jgi:hypothetical protein